MKSRLWFWLKTIIAICLIVYLYQNGNLTLDSFAVFYDYPTTTLLVASIFTINIILSSLRWKWLLSALGVDINTKSLMDINVIGAFGSVFLLGSVGGDALRAYYATAKMPTIKTKVLLSLVTDRILGLVALLILTAGAAVSYYTKFDHVAGSHDFMQVIFVLLALCVFAGMIFLFLIGRFDIRNKLASYKQESRVIRLIVQLLDGIIIFKKNYLIILLCLVASLLMQLGTLWSLAILGQAIIEQGLSTFEYMTASSFSLLANSVPLTPGGIGIGEGAFNYFCELLSHDNENKPYSSVFFSYRIIISLISLVGLWRFIVYKNQEKRISPAT